MNLNPSKRLAGFFAPAAARASAQKNKDAGSNDTAKTIREKEKQNEDYWERIADDPASGYKDDGNADPLLNSDQQPDDNKKGDKAV